MSNLRPCIECGEPAPEVRCPACKLPDDKPNARANGYDERWRALSKRARRMQPWCTDCGATNDLQLDHTPETWQRFHAGKPIRLEHTGGVVCGPCNRARGAARGHEVDRPEAPAHRKASSGLHTPGGMS